MTLLTHTKMFIELLAPLFIAILTIAALMALVKWHLTTAAIGLGTLGALGLIIVILSGLAADFWAYRHTARQVKAQIKDH